MLQFIIKPAESVIDGLRGNGRHVAGIAVFIPAVASPYFNVSRLPTSVCRATAAAYDFPVEKMIRM